MQTSALANPLATVAQLETSSSRLDGVPADLEDSVRFAGARLTQAAGILLRLPQEIIAQAIIVFTRFLVGPEGGSLLQYDAKQVSASSVYLMSKLSAYSKTPRSIINVYAYLDSLPSTFMRPEKLHVDDAEAYYVSEGTYQSRREQLMKMETIILKTLGFNLHIALPYTLCIMYLQTLDVLSHPRSSELSQRAFAHLNAALFSPQLLYLTHQPPTLATAAIYLAAKEVKIKLPDVEWWEVFDTDREELGFLVVGLLSMGRWADEEVDRWGKKRVPLTVVEVAEEVGKRDQDD